MLPSTLLLVAINIFVFSYAETINESGRRLMNAAAEDLDVNPEELGEYLEGDIVGKNTRNGLIAPASRWPNGEIPYEISGSFNQRELNLISDAMDEYHKHTCIRFKPRISSDADYIVLQNANTGCWSSVGRIGGRQEVNLQTPGCFSKVGTPIHELMHAVGFMHEQNRYERDDFVDIVWPNIQNGREINFKKVESDTISGYGVGYDLGSVMHYSEKAFTNNGKATIVAKRANSNAKLGQRDGFSKSDIQKIRKMYNCMDRDEESPSSNNNHGHGNNNNNNGGGGLISMIFGK